MTFVSYTVTEPSTRVFLFESDGTIAGIIEAFTSLEWTRRLWEPSTMVLTVDSRLDSARLMAPGMILGIIDDPSLTSPDLPFMIEDIDRVSDIDGRDTIVVYGVEPGLFPLRICLPPPWYEPFTAAYHEMTVDAETFMKDLVARNVGHASAAPRRYAPLVIAANQNRGTTKTYLARFEVLSDKLHDVGREAGLGWEVKFSGVDVAFDVVSGVDRTDSAVFDVELDTAVGQEWSRHVAESRNLAYVAGQGEGVLRDVLRSHVGPEPEGIDRREMFVDARDLDSSSQLVPRGQEQLSTRVESEMLVTRVYDQGPIQYRRDYDLGDTVRIRHTAWGLEVFKQVVEVFQARSSQGNELLITLGKPKSTLRDQVKKEIGNRGSERM